MPTSEHVPSFTIKAKDRLALETIRFYRDLCEHGGMTAQAAEVTAAWIEMSDWQNAHLDQVKDPDHKHRPAGNPAALRLADTLHLVREADEALATTLYIDDVCFPYFTQGGYVYESSRKGERTTPGVTLTIAARRVSIVDERWEAGR